MAKRAASWMLEPIPGYDGLSRGGAALIDLPALPTEPDSQRAPPRKAVRVTSGRRTPLYWAGMTFGLVVGTTLGLGVLGIAGF